MNYKMVIIFSLFTHLTHATSGWSASTNNSDDKQHINFYGTLLTHQGQTDTVDHILIEGKHNDIVMYDAPTQHATEQFNQKTKQTEIKLETNPSTEFVKSKIDLSKIENLKVPQPSIIWIYQKDKKLQRQEFLLVQITHKGNTSAKDYLLEHKTRVSCISTDHNESQKKEVPLAAIDTLTIEGYSFALNDKKSTTSQAQTVCQKVKTETETTSVVVK